METKQFLLLLLPAILGVIIILACCYRLVFKNQPIDKMFIVLFLIGLVLVVIPIAGNIQIQWGDLQVSIRNINEKSREMKYTLDSLTNENQKLLNQVAELSTLVSQYQAITSNPQSTTQERKRAELTVTRNLASVYNQVHDMSSKLSAAIKTNNSVINDIKKYDRKKWFIKK